VQIDQALVNGIWSIISIVIEVLEAMETKVVVSVDDLHQGLRVVALKAKVLCCYGTFD